MKTDGGILPIGSSILNSEEYKALNNVVEFTIKHRRNCFLDHFPQADEKAMKFVFGEIYEQWSGLKNERHRKVACKRLELLYQLMNEKDNIDICVNPTTITKQSFCPKLKEVIFPTWTLGSKNGCIYQKLSRDELNPGTLQPIEYYYEQVLMNENNDLENNPFILALPEYENLVLNEMKQEEEEHMDN